MDRSLLLLCNGFSCFIITTILFQFMEIKYKRSFSQKYIYVVAEIIIVVCTTCINLFNNSIMNLVVWEMLVALVVYLLYYENVNKPARRVVESEALMISMSVCESLGVIVLEWLLQVININNIDSIMLYCLEVTFSKLILIFLYYAFINRFIQKNDVPGTKIQYIIYGVIFLYSLVNMIVIIKNFNDGQKSYLCAVNMGCIVLADLCLLYYTKMINEKNFYENQVKALEQQASMQYKYYLSQNQKYEQTVRILHDVNKHIKFIEELYETEQGNIASNYASEIRNILKPLIPRHFTENPILNILLTDKQAIMKEKDIAFDIDIENVDVTFIEPIDVTTIFGNLLDNAIEATEKIENNKFIHIKISAYRKILVVKIENSCGDIKWKNGMPISDKGLNRGIGLINVKNKIEKYHGDLTLKQENNRFIAELFLNS